MKHKWLMLIGALVIVIAGAYFYIARPILFFDEAAVPKFVTANVVDPSRIYLVSRFRSAAGHDYSNTWDGETCRSMKHYLNRSHDMSANRTLPLRSEPTATDPNIAIYAPFDGWITANDRENTPIGRQVHVRSEQYPAYTMRIFHIDLLPSLSVGSHVTSGEQIATIGPRDGTDISIEAIVFPFRNANISYFSVMTDEVFVPWERMGYKRADFILTRDYRDLHPLICPKRADDKFKDAFEYPPGYDWRQEYILLRPDPYDVEDHRP